MARRGTAAETKRRAATQPNGAGVATATGREAAPAHVPYVQKLGLSRRCGGVSALTRSPIDLSAVLGDQDALRAMADELFLPFRQSLVHMIVGVLEEDDTDGGNAGAHVFTAAVAGAIAGRHSLALGQMSVQRRRERQPVTATPRKGQTHAKKRGRVTAKETEASTIEPDDAASLNGGCTRVAHVALRRAKLNVEFRRDMLADAPPGMRVLLVSDWIEQEDAMLAARDVLVSEGHEVVGICCVVATSRLLRERFDIHRLPLCCSWAPSSDAQVTLRAPTEQNLSRCQCNTSKVDKSAHTSPLKKRKRPDDDHVAFHHCTSHHEANSPSEDRSVNATKPSDSDVRLYAVFDGHGGSIAVEHVKKQLCTEVFDRVSSDSTQENVVAALEEAFLACDLSLRTHLESLSTEVRMSKGYCNTGSCAVVALIVNSTLYVANVGDCTAVIGRRNPMTGDVWARELSIEHNCRNQSEVKLVMERSRDRNAIRLSKDDQVTENAFGVKRVAGSLAVTRAFGDFYLKCEEFSSAPFKSKVPYITAQPSISVYDLDDDDGAHEQFLILASDGLWEVVGSEEAVKVATSFDPRASSFFPSAAAALVHVALEKIAHRDGMLLHELLALPRGQDRRRFHDDITCTVVNVRSHRARIMSADTVEETDATKPTDGEQHSESPSIA